MNDAYQSNDNSQLYEGAYSGYGAGYGDSGISSGYPGYSESGYPGFNPGNYSGYNPGGDSGGGPTTSFNQQAASQIAGLLEQALGDTSAFDDLQNLIPDACGPHLTIGQWLENRVLDRQSGVALLGLEIKQTMQDLADGLRKMAQDLEGTDENNAQAMQNVMSDLSTMTSNISTDAPTLGISSTSASDLGSSNLLGSGVGQDPDDSALSAPDSGVYSADGQTGNPEGSYGGEQYIGQDGQEPGQTYGMSAPYQMPYTGGQVSAQQSDAQMAQMQPQEFYGQTQPQEVFGQTQPQYVGQMQPQEVYGQTQPREVFGQAQPPGFVGEMQPREYLGEQNQGLVGGAFPATPGALSGGDTWSPRVVNTTYQAPQHGIVADPAFQPVNRGFSPVVESAGVEGVAMGHGPVLKPDGDN